MSDMIKTQLSLAWKAEHQVIMLKRLHLVEVNNDGKPDEVKVSRPVWGEG